MKKERVGERHLSNEGCWFTIVEYNNTYNCIIKFDINNFVKTVEYSKIKSGEIKNPYHKSIYGKGFIGDGIYERFKNKKATKVFRTWSNIFMRCNDEGYIKKHSHYIDSKVSEDWLNFQVFAAWFEKNYIEGFELDKDILFKGNKIYSPETCCFVPHEINNQFVKSNKIRGEYPLGVYKNGNKYVAQITKQGKILVLGSFKTPEEAFNIYKEAKEEYIKEVADKYREQITEACYQALTNYKVEITD